MISEIFTDALGYAGTEIIRRIVGVAHVADFESIESNEIRETENEILLTGTGISDLNEVTPEELEVKPQIIIRLRDTSSMLR